MTIALIAIAIAAIGSIGFHAVFIATHRLRLSRVDAPIAGLGPALNGFTIAILTDLHHIPGWSASQTQRAIDLVRAEQPDLVVMLGDYGASFDHIRRRSTRWYAAMMRELSEPLRALAAEHRVIAVLGNHDHYTGAQANVAWLASLGITVLVNDATTIVRDGDPLVIGGVDDVLEGTVDPMGGCGSHPNDAPTIVLSHNPDGVLRLSPRRRIDLVLSGHTHGGQVVVPGYGAPLRHARVCGRHTASGWVPNERAPLYVSRGVGAQIPLRFACTGEVVLMTLRPSTHQLHPPRPSPRPAR